MFLCEILQAANKAFLMPEEIRMLQAKLHQRLQLSRGTGGRDTPLVDLTLLESDDQGSGVGNRKPLLHCFHGCNPFLLQRDQLQQELNYDKVLVSTTSNHGLRDVDAGILRKLAAQLEPQEQREGGWAAGAVIDYGIYFMQSVLHDDFNRRVWLMQREQYDKGVYNVTSPCESRFDKDMARRVGQATMSTAPLRLSIVNIQESHWVVVAGRLVPVHAAGHVEHDPRYSCRCTHLVWAAAVWCPANMPV